jgi:predicted dehydrogenase
MCVGDALAAAEDALAGGRHVLVVADPCPPLAAIEGLARRAESGGARCAVANPDRYLPSRVLVKQHLAGPLGAPGLIRLHRWEPPPASAGAAFPDQLLRDLDAVLWLAGAEPDRVYAVESQGGPGRCIQVHLGFASGGSALVDYTNGLPPGDDYQSLQVIARGGAAYADDHQNAQLVYRGGHALAVRTDARAGQLAAAAQDFVDALRAGRDPGPGAAEWRRTFALADAVRRSLASGRAAAPEAHA